MATPKTGKTAPKPFDNTVFEAACRIQCTKNEIASLLSMSHETLERKVLSFYGKDFALVYKEYAEQGKASLRRTQMDLAKKSSAMAIFLGKQMLGQSDNPTEDVKDADLMKSLCEAVLK